MDWKRILVFSLLLLGCLQFIWLSYTLAFYDYDVDYTEGFILRDTENLLEGSLYSPPSFENNYTAEKYPPVFYTSLAALSSLLGLSYTAGRLISVISILGSSVLIYLIADRKTENASIIPSLMVFCSFLSVYSGLLLRVDMLGIMFSLMGLYFMLEEKYFSWLVASIAAIFTKQIFLSVFLAGIAYLYFKKDWKKDIENLRALDYRKILERRRKTLKFGLTYFILILGITALIQYFTGGFIQNIALSNIGGWNIRYGLLKWSLITFVPLFGLSFYYLYIFRDSLFGSYFIFSLFLGLIQFTRGGAFINAMMEPFLASLICLGLFYAKVPSLRNKLNIAIIVQLVIFFIAPMVNGALFEVSSYTQTVKEPDQKIVASIDDNYSSVYSENPGYAWRETSNFPPEVWSYYERYEKGKISQQEIVQLLKKKNYSVIVSQDRLDKLPLEDYIRDKYQLQKTVYRKNLNLATIRWKIYQKTEN